MKKIIKDNWFVLAVIIIFCGIIFYADNDFLTSMKRNDEFKETSLIKCQNEKSTSTEEGFAEFCDRLSNEKNEKVDFYSMLTTILNFNIRHINLFAFLILIIPSLIIPSKLLKYKSINNLNFRESYHSFIIKYLKVAYKYIWLLPLLALIIILPIALLTTFDPSYAINNYSSVWASNIIYHPVIFIILYILNILLYSFTFINIALIILRKQHNYLLAIIFSFLCYVGIELFLEAVVNVLFFQMILNSELGYLFNITNLFMFSDQFGIENLLIFTFVVFAISMLLLYLSYRDKEKLVIDCEKNN